MARLSSLVILLLFCFISVGAPIEVTKTDNPTNAQVAELHATYVQKLTQLFDDNREKYDVPESTKLIIN